MRRDASKFSVTAWAFGLALLAAGCRQANPPVINDEAASVAHTQQTGEDAPSKVEAPTTDSANDPFVVLKGFNPVLSKLDGYGALSSCNIDSILDPATDKAISTVPSGSQARFLGWAANVEAGELPLKIALLLRGKEKYYVAGGVVSVDRDDVAKATAKPGILKSGFDLTSDLSAVEVGTYSIDILMDFGNSKASCVTTKNLQVQ